MAQQSSAHVVASLKALTYRITSTPTKNLPPVAAQIAAGIWNCKDVLSANVETSKASSDVSTITTRFRSTLTSLLQNRTVEGRWSAAVLAKAAIEAGGLPMLSKSNGWVKSLIAILKKSSDPPTTRQLTVIVLTRIFQLTWPHQERVREITTPALPAFISACLANAQRESCGDGEIEAVLEAFCVLIPRHPTVFRTHETQVRGFFVRVLSSTSTSGDSVRVSKANQQSAARLLVLLHHCAPKQGGADAWATTWSSAISSAHQTCDVLLRSIVEEAPSDSRVRQSATSGDAEFKGPNSLGLQGWNGIYAGSERLCILLKILQAHLETPFNGGMTVRIGQLIQLISRILSLTLDIEADASRFNHQIPKDEREALFCVLPDIHVAGLELVAALLRRFGKASLPFAQTLLDHTLAVFHAEASNSAVRVAVDTALDLMLEIMGPSMTRAEIAELGLVISTCCSDLSPTAVRANQDLSVKAPQVNGTNGIASKSSAPTSTHPTQLPALEEAAASLLVTLVSKINPTAMPNKSRIEIERTATATRNKEALLACVLNPMSKSTGKTGSSLLPILAREFPGTPEVEAILRPRMPPIMPTTSMHGTENGGIEDFEAENAAFSVSHGMEANDRFYNDPRALNPINPDPGAEELQRTEEDLYSVTPPREGLKRAAEVELEMGNAGKRARMSPAVDSGVGVEGTVGMEIDVENGRNLREVVPTASVEHSEKLPSPPRFERKESDADPSPALGTGDEVGAALNGGESDDSDFEMPPLTMEPDTDPEDEEEE